MKKLSHTVPQTHLGRYFTHLLLCGLFWLISHRTTFAQHAYPSHGTKPALAYADKTPDQITKRYTCSMHPEILRDKPGDCPICGMTLVPVDLIQEETRIKGSEKKEKSYEMRSSHTPTDRTKQEKSKSTQKSGKVRYTCGMHPQIIKDKPGKCPICGMNLVPLKESISAVTNGPDISIDPLTVQNMGIRTALIQKGPLRRIIRGLGTIEYNEQTLVDITIKFAGWIETLYADFVGKEIGAGEALFEIYSPELYKAQTEYLLSLDVQEKAAFDMQPYRQSGLSKLKFFDLTETQITDLEKTKTCQARLPIYSKNKGVIIEKNVVQGQMVQAGMTLFRLADLSTVWIQSHVYEQDLPFLTPGKLITFTLDNVPEHTYRGYIQYIYPTVDEKTRTVQVRIEAPNPDKVLKPGMFVTSQINVELEDHGLRVPEEAILHSGQGKTVFVALEKGHFEPRLVKLGLLLDDHHYQVLDGLKEGERVVISGQFMLDSESQLREALQKMQGAKQS